ncbi:MAG: glycerate kinase [Cetobacterium sp.]|uniref:glycerate kinase n=1 Tax=Cetobacterium sp. ZWU0022 TaxID=1340502 RepID=UPI000690D44E|nr:glycerate kinase [Cetobacterium sp. ZWU0022]
MNRSEIKVVVAIDSLKGSISSKNAAISIEKGIKKVLKGAIVKKITIADGGEGTVEAVVESTKGEYKTLEVCGPFGKKVNAKIGILKDDIIVMEMAESSGLNLVPKEKLNPHIATTYGVGEMLKYALDMKAKKIYIGLGGSATSDGGAGMLNALGVKFYDSLKEEIGSTPKELSALEFVDFSNLDKRLKDTEICILSDVNNPLCGKNGAAYIYGPQKGATPEDVIVLDKILKRYSEKIDGILGVENAEKPGSGAAGGLGYALLALCGGTFSQGIEEILKIADFESEISDANLVITGEGRIDNQSINGKAPVGIAKLSKKHGKPVIAIVGSSSLELDKIYESGIDLVLDIVNEPMALEKAMTNVEKLLEFTAEKAMRAYLLNR